MTLLSQKIESTNDETQRSEKVATFIILTAIGILVYTLAGYNYSIDSSTRLIVRIIVPITLAGFLFILKRMGRDLWFSIVFTFFSVSVGFLATHFLGTWYRLVPGLSQDTAQGIALAKFAEVLPIVFAVITLGFLVGENWTSIKMRGGDVYRSMRLGVYALPLSYLSFLFMGGTIIVITGMEFLTIIPWILLFALSNSFMEELIFRGVFLDKLEKLFGARMALVQTSLIFALFHVSVLQATGFEMIAAFLVFIMILGFAWGYIVQKSDSIWGAVFAHAVADIFVIIVGLGLF